MTARVLITGHQGYLGSVLTPLAVEAGDDVVGLDTGYFADCTLVPEPLQVPMIRKDLRDLAPADLEGFDAVIHLAALSNDPLGSLNPDWTDAINVRASVRLAELAKAAGVRRLLFSSSCIMYGMAEALTLTEDSPVAPQTAYARSKVEAERAIAALADDAFSPTFLRNGTIYGLSPRMRFDTVLNNLVACAVTSGAVVLHGDGSPWRPVAHIEDVARAFLHVLHAPIERVHHQAFNTGEDGMNHQILELAEAVAEAVPGAGIERLGRPEADQRTYKTDFGKFARAFPDFRFRWTVADGARQLAEAFREMELTRERFEDRRFTRLAWLRHLLDAGRLDGELRWQPAEVRAG